jgi:hypothetical protein
MSKTSTKKYKYSKIQYFFWLLSGAEISILKDCPTDYNRQAGIGFTIFMTTLLAFFSGSYAGYYFGENALSAVIFGIIWASLIFSIDRSMVVTLKKDPTKEKQNFWAAFLSRGVLAILIAFIISIPLELLIFRDNIDIHKNKFKQDKTLNIIYGQSTIEDIDGKKEISSNLEGDINELNNLISKGYPQNDIEYDNLKREFKIAESEYISYKNKYNNLNTQAINAYNSGNMDRYYQISNQRSIAKKNMSNYGNKNYFPKKRELEVYVKNWAEDRKKELVDLGEEKKKINEKIKKGTDKVESAGSKIDSILSKHDNSFVFNFMVLEDLAKTHRKVLKPVVKKNIDSLISKTDSLSVNVASINQPAEIQQSKLEWVSEYDSEGATILFLLWLIRILFFTIEILPTISKVATPIGAYDRAIYRKEKDLELELEERTSEYLKQQKTLRDIEYEAEQEQIKERTQIENNLHKELLTEIANVQNKIAREKIEEFKSRNSAQTKVIV